MSIPIPHNVKHLELVKADFLASKRDCEVIDDLMKLFLAQGQKEMVQPTVQGAMDLGSSVHQSCGPLFCSCVALVQCQCRRDACI